MSTDQRREDNIRAWRTYRAVGEPIPARFDAAQEECTFCHKSLTKAALRTGFGGTFECRSVAACERRMK